MNLNKFMFASMILGGLSACSKDDVVSNDNGNGGSKGDAYMSLSISMPKANGSRATTEAGTSEEQKVSNLSVYIWDLDGNLIKDKNGTAFHFTENDLVPAGPNHSEPDKSTMYTTKLIAIPTGNYRIAVIVNGNGENINSPKELRNEYTLSRKQVELMSTKNHFLMTNATIVASQDESGTKIEFNKDNILENNKFYSEGTVAAHVTGNKTNPTNIVIPVERSVAKLEAAAQATEFSVTNTDGHTVKFTNVAIINANKKYFPIKNLRPLTKEDLQKDYKNNESSFYVVDPNFEKQDINTKFDFYFHQFVPTNNIIETSDWEDITEWKSLANTQTFYTLENTMTKDEQKNAFTTGLYYKAVYKIKGQKYGDNVYRYTGKLFTFEELGKQEGINLETAKLTEKSSINDFAAYGITKFENGVCYYPYWIRHNNYNDNVFHEMEFGIVRNNWYKMKVETVSGIGTNVPENPDPNTPDKNPETMLEVSVQVMPWTIRNNNIDF